MKVFARSVTVAARIALSVLYFIQTFIFGAILLILLNVQKGFFDRQFYRTRYPKTEFRQRFPMIDFAFSGAAKLRKPNAWFSQKRYRQQHPKLAFAPVLHYLLDGPPLAARSVPASKDHQAQVVQLLAPAPHAADDARDRFLQLWPTIKSDAERLSDKVCQLSVTSTLQEKLGATRLGSPITRCAVATHAVIAAMPAHVDHLLVLPWLGIRGGSERITQHLIRFLREHPRAGSVCVFAPDVSFQLAHDKRGDYEVPIVAANDFDSTLNEVERIELFDRVMIELRPRSVHAIHSRVGWLTFMKYGRHYLADSNLFLNIYSDVRVIDGRPLGFYWQSLPYVIENVTAIIADNQAVISRARESFGFTSAQMARHHVVSTPILGFHNTEAESELRTYRDPKTKHTLWMSRISIEKRIDLLRTIVEKCPDRTFSIYGVSVEGSQIDMTWTQALPNVKFHGHFENLSDLPIDEFDSYIFTSVTEGMPIALLEMTMLGLPIVAPDVGGIGEFIDEKTGWLVGSGATADDYIAAIDMISANSDEASKRVAAAQARLLERHSWSSFKRQLAQIPGYLNAPKDH